MIAPWILEQLIFAAKKTKWICLVALLITGNIIRAFLIYYQVEHPVVYMLPFTHFEAMLGGITIGLGLFDGFLLRIYRWALLFGLISGALIFSLPNTNTLGWSLMVTYPLAGISMSLIIGALMNGRDSLFKKFLRTNGLVYLGKRAYGLYIYHLLSISIIILNIHQQLDMGSITPMQYQVIALTIGLALTILISVASYSLIELPFLKKKTRFGSSAALPESMPK